MLLWLPPEAPSPRRHRRDSLLRLTHPELRVGVRGRYQGLLRRDRPRGPDGPGATSHRGQACLGSGEGVPEAGILTEDGRPRDTNTGTPQGGILSPLLANIALSVLDEHFTRKWEALGSPNGKRSKHRRAGGRPCRFVRYADDFVVMVSGQPRGCRSVVGEVGTVLAPMGLRLSEEKTKVCHIDEGFDFLGCASSGGANGDRTSGRSTPTHRRGLWPR